MFLKEQFMMTTEWTNFSWLRGHDEFLIRTGDLVLWRTLL